MTNTCTAAGCNRPAQTGLCAADLAELVSALRRLAFSLVERRDRSHGAHDAERRPGLYEDLDDTITRQDNTGSTSIGLVSGATESPVLFHTAASDLKRYTDAMVSTWALAFAELHPHLTRPAGTPQQAEWLATFPTLLAEHPNAGALHDDITGLVDRIRRMVDRSPDKVYLGVCGATVDHVECEQDLYALPRRNLVQCPTCGSVWDATERRAWLLKVAEDQLDTASEISRALSRLGRPVTPAMIRGYAHRGRLVQHPHHPLDHKKRPRYRIGDVIDLLDAAKEAS